ncbi:hypothetical protein WA171_006586 [Blastocystis sp. BT1]
MIQCTLSCVQYISILYDSMVENNWYGFSKWMCFKCGRVFYLNKKVGYDRNTLLLVDSSCNHPVCSYCDSCWTFFNAPIGSTDFQQFNILRLDYQCISFTQDVLNTVVGVTREKCNKCFLFNMLICFIRAKIFKHIFDLTGALMNLGIGTVCTLQGLFDGVGCWGRNDFLNLARQLDGTNDAAAAFRIIERILNMFCFFCSK